MRPFAIALVFLLVSLGGLGCNLPKEVLAERPSEAEPIPKQATQKHIAAESLTIVDTEGRERMRLFVSDSGRANVVLSSGGEETLAKIRLSVGEQGDYLALAMSSHDVSKDEEVHVGVGILDGVSSIMLAAPQGGDSIHLSSSVEGTRIELHDSSIPRVSIGNTETVVVEGTNKGEERKSPLSHITIFDSEKNIVWERP
jgi:hypothetical protein